MTDAVRVRALVSGHVQGVGFRWWTRAQALAGGLAGHAKNLSDGRVEVVAEGPSPAVEALLAALIGADPPGRVDHVVTQYLDVVGLSDFQER